MSYKDPPFGQTYFMYWKHYNACSTKTFCVFYLPSPTLALFPSILLKLPAILCSFSERKWKRRATLLWGVILLSNRCQVEQVKRLSKQFCSLSWQKGQALKPRVGKRYYVNKSNGKKGGNSRCGCLWLCVGQNNRL